MIACLADLKKIGPGFTGPYTLFKKWKNKFIQLENWCKKNKISKIQTCLNAVLEDKIFDSGVGEDSLSRFDQPNKHTKKKKRNNKRKFQNGPKKTT